MLTGHGVSTVTKDYALAKRLIESAILITPTRRPEARISLKVM
ncbi:hypothetical protein [Lichenicoccus sp.]